MSLHFLSAKHLATWLREHPDGQKTIADVLASAIEDKCRACPWAERQRPVLVVLYSDGWVEVYAGADVSVRVETKLWSPNAVAGLCAENYLESTLPKRFTDVYWPRNCRAVGQCRQVFAEDVMEAAWVRAILKGLREDVDQVKGAKNG